MYYIMVTAILTILVAGIGASIAFFLRLPALDHTAGEQD
jgi:hypothetical protein